MIKSQNCRKEIVSLSCSFFHGEIREFEAHAVLAKRLRRNNQKICPVKKQMVIWKICTKRLVKPEKARENVEKLSTKKRRENVGKWTYTRRYPHYPQ